MTTEQIVFVSIMYIMGVGFTIVWTWLMLFVMSNRYEVEMKVFIDRMERASRGEYKGWDWR